MVLKRIEEEFKMNLEIIKAKRNQIQSKLDWQFRRSEILLREAISKWFDFTIKQIRKALYDKYIRKDIVGDLTNWDAIKEKGKKLVNPVLVGVMEKAGQIAFDVVEYKEVFDVLNVRSIEAANKIAADMVVEVTKETKKGIKLAIKEGLKEGKGMDKIARELRPLVGLTENQTQSVINYRKLLEDKKKFPKLTAVNIDKKTQRYADKTHRRRTQTIARTETANAQNIGYIDGLEDSGLVEEVEFSASPGACKICRALDGNKYTLKEGRGIIAVHPNCRCAMLPVI